jgi:hypothetical protein
MRESSNDPLDGGLDGLVFPYSDDGPTGGAQLSIVLAIALDIPV